MTAAVPTTMTAAGTASSHPGASGVAAVAATRTGSATEESGRPPLAPKVIAAVSTRRGAHHSREQRSALSPEQPSHARGGFSSCAAARRDRLHHSRGEVVDLLVRVWVRFLTVRVRVRVVGLGLWVVGLELGCRRVRVRVRVGSRRVGLGGLLEVVGIGEPLEIGGHL